MSLPERPSQVLAGALLFAIILLGHRAAPFVLDPASAPTSWLPIVAWVCAVTVGCTTATLTTLVYSLVYFRDSEPSRVFLKWIAHMAGVGAALGLLLGLRVAWPLATSGKPSGQPFTFLDLLSEVSNTATFMTMFMIAITCWWRLFPLLANVAVASAKKLPDQRGILKWIKVTLPSLTCLAMGNISGYFAGWSVLIMMK